jgi:hypothetical protein
MEKVFLELASLQGFKRVADPGFGAFEPLDFSRSRPL